MSEEKMAAEEEQAEKTEGEESSTTEEIKVQAQDLFDTINNIIRQGTAKRITVMRNDRILVDIPLVVGVSASLVFAIYMPILSAIVAVVALFGGCTVRVERDEPEDDA